MFDRELLLSHLHRDQDLFLAGKILDKAEIVIKRKTESSTAFLNPYQRDIATGILENIAEINFIQNGGYQKAERKRIIIFPEYLFPDHVDPELGILKLTGNFNFQSISHKDVLGALMSLGIKRNMIGDILVMDDFSQVIVAREMVEFILTRLKSVHEVPVQITEIEAEDIVIPVENARDIKATVASMRLDAVASAGFGDSRNKISREIENGRVKLNWKPEDSSSCEVQVNDLISIRGRGRVKVVERTGISHRGRIKLLLKRYT